MKTKNFTVNRKGGIATSIMLLIIVITSGLTAQTFMTQSFDTQTLPTGWSTYSSSTSTNALWKFSGSPSYDAGGTIDNTGNGGWFAWVDASTPYVPDVTLETDSIDLQGATSPLLSFYLSSILTTSTYVNYGYNPFYVVFYNGNQWDTIFQYQGNNNGWTNYTVALPSYSGKVVFKFIIDKTGSNYFYHDMCLDDILVYQPAPMVYSSSTTTQTNSLASLGASDVQVLGIEVVTSGDINPLNITNFSFNTNGSTSPSTDIVNAKLYSTGQTGSFNTATQYGTTIANPNGNFSITGNQTLVTGTNYFWLVYDISNSATVNNYVDAECTSIMISSTSYTPNITAPAGNLEILTVSIAGTDNQTNLSLPIEPYYGYSYSQSIYKPTELNFLGNITKIGIYYNGNSSWGPDNFDIYMGSTTQNSYLSTSDWIPYSNLTKVYTGTLSTTTTPGWIEFTLDIPFFYDGTSNLVVGWHESTTGYHSSSDEFYCSELNLDNSSLVYYSDNTNPDPASPPTASYLRTQVPNVKITYSPPIPNDAGIAGFYLGQLCPGTNNVDVVLQNAGTSNLTSTTIYASVNNVLLNPSGFSWTGNLANGDKDTVTIGTYSFIYGIPYDFEAYSSMPNGVADQNNTNDTTSLAGLLTGLSGNYTINAASPTGGTNFASFSDFAAALANGVCGPIMVDVASGVYDEQFTLTGINGVSSTNTITIQSASGDSTDVVLQYAATSSTANWVVGLENINYLTLKNMTLKGNGSSYGRVLVINDDVNYLDVSNCVIETSIATSSNFVPIYANGSSDNYSYNTIQNNKIFGGYYGIYWYGNSSNYNTNNSFINNEITDYYYYGTYFYYNDNATWQNNSYANSSASGTVYGMRLYYGNNNIVDNNIINVGGTSTTYGIYAYYNNNATITNNQVTLAGSSTHYGIYHRGTGTALNPNLIANNTINMIGTGTSTWYGLYPYYSDTTNIYHNTVNIEGGSTSSRALYAYYGSSISLLNNILNNQGGGYAIYANNTTNIVSSDHNVLYTTGSTLGYYGGSQTTLTDWQTATGFDANSVDFNPALAAPMLNDLTPLNIAVDNIGIPIPSITTDIFGAPRSATTPDAGAIEFTGLSGDLAVIDGMIKNGICLSTNDSVFITVNNLFGTTVDFSVNPLTVGWEVTGPVNSNGTITVNTGTLAVGNDLLIEGDGVDMSAPGTYTLTVYMQPNTVNNFSGNDTLNNIFTLDIMDPFFVIPKYTEITDLDSTIVALTVQSTFFPGGTLFLTEIGQYSSTSTGQPVGGTPSYLGNDYIEITGVPNSDISGYMIEKWTSSGSTPNAYHTFPAGTTLSPAGTYLVSTYQGTTSLIDYHQSSDVGSGYSSSTNSINIIKDPSGNIIDVALYGTGSTIPANAGVTTEWTGPGVSGTSSWGIRLIGPDTDDNTNWVKATQDPNILNAGVPLPSAGNISGFTWSHNSVVTSTKPDTIVGPFTANGLYEYIASYNTPCGILTDTAKINVIIPPYDATMVEILPNTEGCGLGQEAIEVKIANRGSMSISSNLTASYMIAGGSSVVTEPVTTTINSGDTINFTFATLADFSVTGADSLFQIIAWTTLLNDTIPANDTATSEVNSLHIPVPPVVNDMAIPTGTQAVIAATSSYDVNWYEQETDITPVYSGHTYTTPVLNNATTYWVEASSGIQVPNSLTTTFAGGNGQSGNMFDITTYNTITIDSFYVNVQGDGMMEVWYRPESYMSYTTTQTGWTMLGSYSVISQGSGNPTLLPIGGLTIPAGNTYGLYVTFDPTGPSVSYTNGSGTETYQDANMLVEAYHGGSYFNLTFSPRIWNGTIFYTAGEEGCSSPKVPVTVSMEATATAITPDTPICLGDQIMLEVALTGSTPITMIVTDGANNDTITGITTPTIAIPVTPTTTTTYSVVEVINAYGFSNTSTASVTVTVNPLPVVTADDVEICDGSTAFLNATGSAGTPPYSYQWNNATTLSNPNAKNPLATPSATTTYTVTITDANGCTATDDAVVTVQPLPVADAGSDINICMGTSAQLAATASGGSGTYSSYDWTPAATLDNATIANPLATPSVTTTYTVVVTDNKGCQDADDVVVSVVDVTAGSDQVICYGASANLGVTVAGGSGSYTYVWTPAASLDNAGLQNPVATPTVTTTYTIAVTDNVLGITCSDDVVVTVNPLPTVSFTGLAADYCVDAPAVTLTGTPAGGMFTGMGISGTTFDPATAGVGGPYTITYTYTDANGCTNSASQQVTINPLPVVSFTGLASGYCIDAPVITLTGTPAGGVFSGAGISGNDFDPATAGVGIHNITYTYTDINGCVNSETQSVEVYPLPIATAIPDFYVCLGSPGQLNVTVTGGTAPYSYQWTPADSLDDATLKNPIVNNTNSETYTVVVTDQNGCQATDSVYVNVIPDPVANAGNDVAICFGESTQLQASGGDVYVWSPTTGLSNPNISNPVASPTATTVYSVTVTSACGTASDYVLVTVNPLPGVNLGSDIDLCYGSSANLNAVVSGAAPFAYAWTPSTDLSDPTISNPVATPLSNTTYTVLVTDVNGCQNSDDIYININPLPTVNATVNVNDEYASVCPGGTVSLSANATPSTVTYQWSPSAYINGFPNNQNVVSMPLSSSVDFSVIATDANGCKNYDTVNVSVMEVDAGVDAEICLNASTQLNAVVTNGITPYSYSWMPATGLSDAAIANPVASPLTTTTYYLTVTDDYGTSCIDSVTVTVNPLPSVTVADIDLCMSNSAMLNAMVTGGTPGYTYNWTPTNDLSDPTIANPMASPTVTTTYNILVTDSKGCTATDDATVTLHALPSVNAGPDAIISSGANHPLMATGSGGQSPYSYQWSPASSLSDATIQNPIASPTVTTTYTVTLTDVWGCTATDDVVISTVNLPIANAGPDKTICIYDSAQLNASGGITYVWSPTTGLSNPNIYNPMASPAVTTTYTVTVTGPYGSAVDWMVVNVNPLPIVSFTGLGGPYCEDDPAIVPLTGTPAGGTFSGPGITGNDFSPLAAGPGNHTIVYSYTDPNGCTNTDTNYVLVHPLPVIDAGTDIAICADDNAVLSATPTGYVSYSWNSNFGTSSIYDPNNSTTTVSPFATTTYTVSVTDINGCTNSDDVVVTVNPLPVVTSSGLAGPYCIDNPLVTMTGTPPGGIFTGPGVVGNDFDASAAGAGTHVITYTYTDANGCTNTHDQTVTVNPLPVVTSTTFSGSDIVDIEVQYDYFANWVGDDTRFEIVDALGTPVFSHQATASSQYYTTSLTLPVGNYTFKAYDNFGDGGITYYNINTTDNTYSGAFTYGYYTETPFTVNGVSHHCINGPVVVHSATPTGGIFTGNGIVNTNEFDPAVAGVGQHQITYTYTDSNGCTNSIGEIANVNALTPTTFSGLAAMYCVDAAAVTLTGTPPGGTFSGTGIIGNDFDPATAGVGIWDIIYTYVDANGCTNADTQTTEVVPLPVLAITNLATDYCIDAAPVTLNATPAGGTFSGNGITGNDFDPAVAGVGIHTITYTYTDANGCTNTITQNTEVHALPIVTIVGLDAGFCLDAAPVTLVGSPSGGIFSGTGVSGNIFDASAAGVGIHTITYTYTDTYGCVNDTSQNVTVYSLPTADAWSDAQICIGDSTNLYVTASGGALPYAYTWTPAAGLDDATIVNPVASPAISTVYTVAVTDANGCTATDSVFIEVSDIQITTTDVDICYGSSTQLNIAVTGGIAPYSYSWTPAAGLSSTTIADPIADPTATTVYTVMVTDNIGCTSSATLTVTVNPLPIVSFSGLAMNYCIDAPAVTLTGSPAGGIFTGPGISGSAFDPAVAGTGTHSITYTYTDANGCINSETQTTTVNPLPTVAFTGLAAGYCVDAATVTLTGIPTGGTFSGPGISGNSFDPALAGVGTHTIMYTYTDGNGCTDSYSETVEVYALPVVTLNTISDICENVAPVTLTGGVPTGGLYSGTGVSGGMFDPAVAGVGQHFITYTYTDANGCINFAIDTITVHAITPLTFATPPAICNNAMPYTLVQATPAGGVYSGPGVSGGQFDPMAVSGPGLYTLTYTYTNTEGCISTINRAITVLDTPTPVAGTSTTVCANTTTPLNVTVTGGGGSYTYQWSPASSIANDPTIANPFAIPSVTTTYTVAVTGANGCIGHDQVIITTLPLPSVDVGPDTLICAGYAYVIPTVVSGNSPFTYQWNNTATLNDGTIQNPTAYPISNTNYSVTVTDANGCVNSDNLTINVVPNPVATITGLNTDYCVDAAPVTLTATPTGGTFTIDGVAATTFDPAVLGVGPHTVIYNYVNTNGCIAVDSMIVTVRDLPSVDAGSDLLVCAGNPTNLYATPLSGTSPYSYAWSPAASLNNAFIQDPIATPMVTTTYTVTLTDVYGCSATDDVTILTTTFPVADAGDNDTICYGGSTQLIATGGNQYQWAPATGLSNPNIANPIASPSVTTVYTVTVTSNCGVAFDFVEIYVNPLPAVSFSGLNPDVCIDDGPITLTGSPAGGIFSGVGITGNVFDPAVAGIGGPYTITYDYVDPNGCANPATQTVTVHALPTISFSGLNTSYCINGTASTLTGSPAGGIFSGPGITGNVFDPAVAGVGTHTITYTYTDGYGCVNTTTQQTTVQGLTAVTFTGLPTSICVDGSVATLYGNPSGGVFSGPGINGNLFDPAIAGAGTHDIVYTISGSGYCTNADTQTVIVNALPVVSFTGLAADYCANDGIVTMTGVPAGGVFSGNAVSANTFDPSNAGVGTHSISYAYTDGNGCSNSTSQITTVHALPTLSINGLSAVYCENDPAVTLSGTPAGGIFSGTGITGNQFDPAVAGAGAHTVYYTYTDGMGCTNTISQLTVVNALPNVTFAPLAPVCDGSSSFALSGGSPTGGSYSGSAVVSGNFIPSAAGPGSHLVTYTYTSPSTGCSNSATQNQVVNVNPVADAGIDQTIPFGTSTSLTGTATGGSGTYSYNWTPTGSLVNANVQNPTTTNLTASTIFDLTVTDLSNGCQDNDQVIVSVIGSSLSVNINAPYTAICDGDQITLTAQAIGGSGVYTYSWTSTPGGTYPSTQAITVSPLVTTTYTVAVDDGYSVETANITITVNSLPTVSFTGLPANTCEGSGAVAMSGTPTGGVFSGPGVNGNLFYPIIAGVGTHTITYTYTDLNGCTNTATQNITVHALPTLTISGIGTDVCINDAPITITVSPQGGILSGPGVNNNIFDPSVAGIGTHTITYTYADNNGCITSTTHTVTVHGLSSVTFTGLASGYCNNEAPVTLTGYPSGGMFSGTGMIGNVFDPSVANGIRTITYTYADGNGCINTASQSTTVYHSPQAYFVGLASQYCESNGPVTLLGSAGVGTGTFSGPGVTGNIFDPAVAGVGTHVLYYSYTSYSENPAGCTTVGSDTVTVLAAPSVTIAASSTSVCLNGNAITLTGTPSGGTFSGSGVTGNIFDPAAAGAGVHTISYTFTGANGCPNTATVDITVHALPTLQINGLSSIYCINSATSSNLVGVPSGGTFSGTGIIGNVFYPTTAGVGTHWIYYTYTDMNGCTVVDSAMTNVDPGPSTSFTGLAASYCIDDAPATLNGSGNNAGTFSGPGMTNNIFDPAQAGAGTHTITYTLVSQTTGCSGIYTQNVTVNALPTVSIAGLGSDYCIDHGNVTMTGTPSGGVFSGTGVVGNTFSPTSAGVGTFTVTYTYTDPNGCTNSVDQMVNVHALPVVSFSGLAPSYCENDPTVLLTGTPSGGVFTGNGVVGNSFAPGLAHAGTHVITYSYTDGNGCIGSYDDTVVVYANPFVDLGPDQVICINHKITLDAGAGFASYLWSTGETTQTILVDGSVIGVGPKTYSVTVTNSNGCVTVETIVITVDPCEGIDEIGEETAIRVFPNPSRGTFNILFNNFEDDVTLEIHNDLGQILMTDVVEIISPVYVKQIDLSTQPTGVYFIRLMSNDLIRVEKIIIN